ncbi:MAG: dienelactone hydrolase family protein [bacterium]|nr:dienelactone hydrolase family protein [bacterium]
MNNDYLSKPPQKGAGQAQNPNGAGIILIHEFWGVNQQIKNTADKIAGQGFAVLAVDLYKGAIAKDADEARKMKDDVTDEHALECVQRAIIKLQEEGIAGGKIAVWGFCFGGSIAFKSAVANLDAGAYVIYYGSMITDSETVLKKIQKPVLGIFGAEDKSIPSTKVETMKNVLTGLGKPNEIYIYAGAGHAFANEECENYNAEAARDAWEKTMAFLKKYLLT